ncbi:MAG: DUF3455 domain-containing protein [Azoarcus sp.]|nr:DUF3455 domain-containing protein [Azoarcus sp.]
MSAIRSILAASLVVGATSASAMVDNAALPAPVQVPAGNTMKLWTVGIGEITYACREKADAPGGYAWTFVAPVATLFDKDNKAIGKYYGGPTWESADGSKITGKQQGMAPGGDGNIALQLVKAAPAEGMGAMQGVSFVQRLNTKGGVAPVAACGKANAGAEQQVRYQADYVFYRASM